CLGN
ncbi:ABC transporter family protein, partial [Vibrio parahaemolyticus V-223/04]